MKIRFNIILFFFFFFPINVYCLEGRITKDTVWEGNIEITGDLLVPSEITLTILPGSNIVFSMNRRSIRFPIKKRIDGDLYDITFRDKPDIIVKGTLIIKGEKDRRVNIGNPNHNNPDYLSWGAIIFLGKNISSKLKYVNISYGMIGVYCWDESSPEIEHCVFENNKYGIVSVDASSPEITDCIIKKNRYGIGVYDNSNPQIHSTMISAEEIIGIGTRDTSSPHLYNNTITENEVGIGCYDFSQAFINNNNISKNKFGITLLNASSPKIEHNLIRNNTIVGIEIRDKSSPKIVDNEIENNKKGISYWLSTTPKVLNNNFKDNEEKLQPIIKGEKFKVFGRLKKDTRWNKRIIVEGDIVVPEGVTLFIEPKTEVIFTPNRSKYDFKKIISIAGKQVNVTFDKKCDIIVFGNIKIMGYRDKPVTIGNPSFINDDISWGGIILLNKNEQSLIKYTHIKYASIGILILDASKVRISNSKISNNRIGINCGENAFPLIESNYINTNYSEGVVAVDNSNPIIKNNVFEKNSIAGIHLENKAKVIILNNKIKESKFGISCSDYSSVEIVKNTIASCDIGLILSKDVKGKIYGNHILFNTKGIRYVSKSAIELGNNLFKKNKQKIEKL